jgi:hypothetical protein
MDIRKSTDKITILLILMSLLLIGICCFVWVFVDLTEMTKLALFMSIVFYGLSFLLMLVNYLMTNRLYRRNILGEPLLTTILPYDLCIEFSDRTYTAYREYHKVLKYWVFLGMIGAGFIFGIIIGSVGDYVAGSVVFLGFSCFGAFSYSINYFKYLPPDVDDNLMVLGSQGVLMFGKFSYWFTNGAYFDSYKYEAETKQAFGILTIEYIVLGMYVTLMIPIPNEVSDQIPEILASLETQLQKQKNKFRV